MLWTFMLKLYSAAVMMYFCNPTLKLITLNENQFSINFGLLHKLSSVTNKLIILTWFVPDNLHKWTQLLWILKLKYNRINRKLNTGYKQITPWSHDCNVTTIELQNTISVFHFPWKCELEELIINTTRLWKLVSIWVYLFSVMMFNVSDNLVLFPC